MSAHPGRGERRLIINADDFGRSSSINQAVRNAHTRGILTTASLMAGGEAFDEAVGIAREHRSLGVGLHLTLVCGRAVLSASQIPGLADRNGRFDENSVRAGIRFFFLPSLKSELEAELEAQFQKFHATGLPLDHINGHLNIHLHPTVLGILLRNRERWGIRRMRWTRDPLALSLLASGGAWAYRLSHAMVFGALTSRAAPLLRAHGIRHTRTVFGLLQNARVDERYLCLLLPRLPDGDFELYSHPSLDEFRHELDALTSPRVRELADSQGIRLIRYSDLAS